MPDLGRWLNPDPLAEEYSSWSPYNYVMNSPLRNIDPTGAFSITLTGQDAQNYMERLINDIKNNEDNNKDVLTANLNDFLANGGGGSNNNDSMNRPIPIGDYSRGVSRRTATGVSPQNNELYSDLGAVSWFGGTVAEGISRNSTYHAKNFIAKYGNRFSSASEITAKTRTSMANTARNAKGVGYGLTIIDVYLSANKFGKSNKNWGNYGELGLGLTSSTLTLFGATAPIGIGIGIIDLSGGFDSFYNHLNQQEKFYQSTGGVMVPTTGIPTFIQLKKNKNESILLFIL